MWESDILILSLRGQKKYLSPWYTLTQISFPWKVPRKWHQTRMCGGSKGRCAFVQVFVLSDLQHGKCKKAQLFTQSMQMQIHSKEWNFADQKYGTLSILSQITFGASSRFFSPLVAKTVRRAVRKKPLLTWEHINPPEQKYKKGYTFNTSGISSFWDPWVYWEHPSNNLHINPSPSGKSSTVIGALRTVMDIFYKTKKKNSQCRRTSYFKFHLHLKSLNFQATHVVSKPFYLLHCYNSQSRIA